MSGTLKCGWPVNLVVQTPTNLSIILVNGIIPTSRCAEIYVSQQMTNLSKYPQYGDIICSRHSENAEMILPHTVRIYLKTFTDLANINVFLVSFVFLCILRKNRYCSDDPIPKP